MNLYKQNKGNNYELFVLNKLKSQYDEVFLFKYVPERILQNTKLLSNYDIYIKKDESISKIKIKTQFKKIKRPRLHVLIECVF
jgi:hypothetical protein